MDDGVDLILAERAFHQRLTAHIAIYDLHAIEQTRAHEFTLRHPITHDTNDVGFGRKQLSDEPAAE